MPTFTIRTPRGDEVDIEAPDEATAIRGAQRWDHEDFAAAEAQAAGLDPSLVLRQMNQESGFRPEARSPKGAVGLMQLMPATAKELGVDPSDPYDNIRGGVRYLKQQMDAFGDEDLALAAYNAGPGAVKKHGGVPPFRETQNYVRAIKGAPAPGPVVTAEIVGRPDLGVGAAYKKPAPSVPQPEKPTSQLLGLAEGLGDAAQGFARIEDRLPIITPRKAMNALTDGLTGKTLMDVAQDRQTEAEGQNSPGKIGRFAGNVIGTGWLPGGPMTSGALSGAVLAEGDGADDIGRGALYGLIGGKVGSSVVGGIGRAVAGVTDDAVRSLAAKGVPLTLGQMSGGIVKGLEDRAAGLPVIGEMIGDAQARSLEGANRAAFDDVLKLVDEKLPDNVPVGSDAYDYVAGRLGELYDEVLEPLTVAKDAGWNDAVQAISQKAGKLPKEMQDELKSIVKTEVADRFDEFGVMTGEGVKAVQEALRIHADDLMKGKKWSRDAAGVLKDLRAAVDDLVSRVDPAAGEQLAKVNRAYAHLKPVERAVAAANKGSTARDAGVFTGNQLATAAMQGKRPGQRARGNLPQLPLAQDMTTRLPSSVPDSGTAGRMVLPGLVGAMLTGNIPALAPIIGPAIPGLALGAGVASAYTKVGQKVATKLMTSRDPAIRKVGQQIRKLAAPAGMAGSVAAIESRQ